MHFTSAPPAVATVGPAPSVCTTVLECEHRTFPLWINGRFLTSICERGDKTVFYGYQKSS